MAEYNDPISALPIVPFSPPEFTLDQLADAHAYLEANGYVVIAGVASPDECAHARGLCWKFFEDLGSGIDRNDPATWSDEHWIPSLTQSKGLVPYFSAGQSEFQWYCRTLPSVSRVFRALWTPYLEERAAQTAADAAAAAAAAEAAAAASQSGLFHWLVTMAGLAAVAAAEAAAAEAAADASQPGLFRWLVSMMGLAPDAKDVASAAALAERAAARAAAARAALPGADGSLPLLVSFDGFSVFRPVAVNSAWKTGTGWFHVDQDGNDKPDKCCIQGALNVMASTSHHGGLVVVPKSHLYFKRLFRELELGCLGDYMPIDDKKMQWFRDQGALGPIKVNCSAGALVLWDSRTVHCNTPAIPPPDVPAPEAVPIDLERFTSFICMTPSSFAADLEHLTRQRWLAYEMGLTTSHWPDYFVPHQKNPPQPRISHTYKPVPMTPAMVALMGGPKPE